MTKKDFEFFNQLIVDHNLSPTVEVEMLRYFQKKNPRFDMEIWRKRMNKAQVEKREMLYG